MVRQGPHHGAQKSTSTGISLRSICFRKRPVERSTGCPVNKGRWHLPQVASSSRRTEGTRLTASQWGQTICKFSMGSSIAQAYNPEGTLRQPGALMEYVNTDRLRIAFRQHGDLQGEPIFLLHGWPDDLHTWDGVLPTLACAGYRLIMPSLRGFGETRFLDHATPRSGQLAALAQDLLDFASALGIERFNVVGHDWGAR